MAQTFGGVSGDDLWYLRHPHRVVGYGADHMGYPGSGSWRLGDLGWAGNWVNGVHLLEKLWVLVFGGCFSSLVSFYFYFVLFCGEVCFV